MKSTLESVREKIIEAVPEIMELKFGCVVEITYPATANGLGAGGVFKDLIHPPKN